MTTADTVSLLWQAVGAHPECRERRGALADAYRDAGFNDEADAVQATADRVPRRKTRGWCWRRDGDGSMSNEYRVWKAVFNRLSYHTVWDFYPTKSRWRRYPTALAALQDLVRAWVAVHRAAVCETCGGSGMIDPGPSDEFENCPDCTRCKACNGSGGPGGYDGEDEPQPCERCAGTGKATPEAHSCV
jgi:hypothetical protein